MVIIHHLVDVDCFLGKLEQGHEVSAESFNECQIMLSATAALREANSGLH